MDYEKKYKEALELARVAAFNGHQSLMEGIFPELAESKDEKTRKRIIALVNAHGQGIYKGDMLTWLENIPYTIDREKREGFHLGYKAGLEKQGEQKPWSEDDKKLTDVNHEYFNELLENNNSKDINDYAYQVAYCMSHDWIEEIATWDDVQKACKLGAEWNEKRHKSAWSEKYIADVFEMVGLAKIVREQSNDSLTNALQDAMIELSKFTPQPKQEWSEEDEERIKNILSVLDVQVCWDGATGKKENPYQKEIDWLKSLKERCNWKPSERQKEALLWCVVHLGGADKQTLGELLEELNKL